MCVRWCFVRSSTRIHCNGAHCYRDRSFSRSLSHSFRSVLILNSFPFVWICLLRYFSFRWPFQVYVSKWWKRMLEFIIRYAHTLRARESKGEGRKECCLSSTQEKHNMLDCCVKRLSKNPQQQYRMNLNPLERFSTPIFSSGTCLFSLSLPLHFVSILLLPPRKLFYSFSAHCSLHSSRWTFFRQFSWGHHVHEIDVLCK